MAGDLRLGSSPDGAPIVVPHKRAKLLRPFQIEGLRFLHGQREKGVGAIVNDETGLGKTVQAILYISALQLTVPNAKTLIICDESSFDHWLYHIEIWTHLSKSLVSDNSAYNITVTSLHDASNNLIQKWTTVIIDDLNTNDVVKILRNIKCDFKIWLVNECLMNDIKKLHTIIKWIDPNGVFSWKDFQNKFSTVENDLMQSWKTRQLLDTYCKSWLMRRTRKMVKDELPLVSIQDYTRSFREWQKQSKAHNESDDLYLIEESHDVMEIEDTTTDESQNSPSILIPRVTRSKVEELKRKGTKDVTGLKIKRNKNAIRDSEIPNFIPTNDVSTKKDVVNGTIVTEENLNGLSKLSSDVRHVLSNGERHAFKLLDDILK